jgi:hypothetical protein
MSNEHGGSKRRKARNILIRLGGGQKQEALHYVAYYLRVNKAETNYEHGHTCSSCWLLDLIIFAFQSNF